MGEISVGDLLKVVSDSRIPQYNGLIIEVTFVSPDGKYVLCKYSLPEESFYLEKAGVARFTPDEVEIYFHA